MTQETEDRARFRQTAISLMEEMAAIHDISDADRSSDDRLVAMENMALKAIEDWLYAAFRINHS